MIEVGQQALSTSFISKLFINVQLFSSIIQSKLLRPRKIFFHFCVGFLVKFKGKWPQLQNYSGTRCWFLEIWIMPTDAVWKVWFRSEMVGRGRPRYRKLEKIASLLSIPLITLGDSFFLILLFFSFVFFSRERERHTRSKIERELLSRSSAEVIEDWWSKVTKKKTDFLRKTRVSVGI